MRYDTKLIFIGYTLHRGKIAIQQNDSKIKIVILGGEFDTFITAEQPITCNSEIQ
jgi:hypothetical protein